MEEVKRILIIKPSSVGDVVHALPLLAVLRRAYPRAHIAWLVSRACSAVLEGHPHLDEVILFDRQEWRHAHRLGSATLGLARLIRGLRRQRFDVAVDLQGLLRSGLLTCLSGSPVRVGFANAREFATLGYNRRVQVPTPEMHAVERYLLVAGALGIEPAGEPDFTIAVGRDEARWARDFLSGLGPEHGPVVLMNPSARWESKRWPANSFAVLADALVRKHAAAVLFTGSPEDRAVVGRVQGLMSQTSIDLAGGTTLKQFIALLAQADLLVCNDSGPMHLAAALGTPLVAFFGPTNPVRTGPYAQARRCVILRKPQDCSPCYRRQCRSGKCLAAVTSAEALEAAESLLEVDGKQAPARNSK